MDTLKALLELSFQRSVKRLLKAIHFYCLIPGLVMNKECSVTVPENLSILSKSNNWFCDGTFKVVPELFFQLYSIHAEFEGLVIPCVYALLSNKEKRTYDTAFRKLLEIEPALNPQSIMVDFEKAAINALENNFISVISACFFSSIEKYLPKNSGRRINYELPQDRDFSLKIKMLPSLAFVPEIDVIDCFNILMQYFPENAISVANYFENKKTITQLHNNYKATKWK